MLAVPMRNLILALLLIVSLLIAGCDNLQYDVNVELPADTPQLAVECYLEPDSVYRLYLTQTTAFLAPANQIPIVSNATVTITYQGNVIPLTFYPAGSPGNKLIFGEYRSTQVVPRDYTTPFFLNITTPDGKLVTGTTTIQRPIPALDTLAVYWNRNEAQIQIAWQKPDTLNISYYRIVYDTFKPDTVFTFIRSDELRVGAKQDFTFTPFRYKEKDTVAVRLYRVSRPYFDWYRSVSASIQANQNPFAQAGRIVSNVTGGIGIFTGIAELRKGVRIPAPPPR